MSEYERLEDLLRRLKVGREEAMQRLITSLIVGGRYPRWNERSRSTPAGAHFLRLLHARSFGEPWPGDDFRFVDEFELRARHDLEMGGAPDWAVLWDDRLWLIELKSERASHRPDQIPGYFTLGHHHFPHHAIDITYLTPSMNAPHHTQHPWERYAHVSWDETVEMLRAAWPAAEGDDLQALVEDAIHAIEHLHVKPSAWRELVLGAPAPVDGKSPVAGRADVRVEEPADEPIDEAAGGMPPQLSDVLSTALELARATGADGKQRALDVRFDSLDSLLEVRLRTRELIAAEPLDASARFVMAWVWRPESTGRPLTEAGRTTGYELRFSKYSKPQV